ncbi:exotoxin beta-grasp domain-containing protein [Staphylococcus intermedius]|uniref:Superantigen-like protein n=1 Tax=Staphylococcus intermedius NCTC 11048 TaxID=1141106 RepID=A0A380G2S4_STAIN|nr:exotoxin beta-grasp domain-containing protein [Staphylococcus intermedius]PCF64352.1 exotoxin [Staphylococcus intermedius]PCF79068.1 exotoxin [Staphylococcus intermedius]PCF80041.1 exotoxin [Staphylococcus intermedius]PCF89298.1 exotoxin [Staphylococcus intermedius]PNZ53111.1 exotoxin [Staphylococcus intermedius NCTC 11048]
MKQSTILKVSLAVGILATGVGLQSHAAALAEQEDIQVINSQTKALKDYYSQTPFKYHNVTGYGEGDKKLSVVTPDQTLVSISLDGSDLSKYNVKDKEYPNLDLFVVREGTDRSAETQSIGGITKTNKVTYHDNVKNPDIVINRESYGIPTTATTNELSINKEEVSLKELDFKLRQMLINKYDLYKNGSSNDKIVIKIGDEDKDIMTLELDKKLQPHRMSDTVDVNKIQKITIDL